MDDDRSRIKLRGNALSACLNILYFLYITLKLLSYPLIKVSTYYTVYIYTMRFVALYSYFMAFNWVSRNNDNINIYLMESFSISWTYYCTFFWLCFIYICYHCFLTSQTIYRVYFKYCYCWPNSSVLLVDFLFKFSMNSLQTQTIFKNSIKLPRHLLQNILLISRCTHKWWQIKPY